MGGADSPLSSELVQLIDYISPNQTELERLAKSIPNGPTCNLTEDELKMLENLPQDSPNRIGFTFINVLREYPDTKLLFK